MAQFHCPSRTESIDRHRAWLYGEPGYENVLPELREKVIAALPSLKDQVLGCFCRPEAACHCDTLAELADLFPG